MEVSGVWLPVVTPFFEGEVDFESYERLIHHYAKSGIKGILPLGTTGEAPVVAPEEALAILKKTVEIVNGRLPVFAGIGGNDTSLVISKVKEAERLGIDGILSVCPYYSRPGQEGLYRHFQAIAEATDLSVLMYNIPCRTGVNMENSTVLRLAEIPNIIGIKDSCGDIRQTLALLASKPENFSVMTGEDHLFLTTLANGGSGGILASAHLETKIFTGVFDRMMVNDLTGARTLWRKVESMVSLLFEEANPGPVKYGLERMGLIRSREMRLPLTDISTELKVKIDQALEA
ncbi:MAG: 4-hydroxy-tetrahydrodipicolinate synthase [Proteobacteria bacterium]|nr:4-hydroxy-tetrahydrodipicolinate synthase [Pseudomonadota bacterium]MBU4472007.1 4-hydroxy-tetrahydrodipicolinate synthase [Pseudomonadota bacterium]MCG2752993.1 4-hydroxy-tetrahydrodipicolinate synthase [Desulfobacteraceae bacterium]